MKPNVLLIGIEIENLAQTIFFFQFAVLARQSEHVWVPLFTGHNSFISYVNIITHTDATVFFCLFLFQKQKSDAMHNTM